MNRSQPLLAALLLLLGALAIACGSSAGSLKATPKASPPATSSSANAGTAVTGTQRATLLGALTIDGQPLGAEFLGAVVLHDGLINACQLTIVPVSRGSYEIDVMADAEARGCGAPGSRILLWTNLGNGNVYSRETLPWPGGRETTFDATFSTSAPQGASEPATEFYGHVSRQDGTRLGASTIVEAFVGDTRCGIATIRDYSGDLAFVLSVAGPDSVPGCTRDASITFTANGAAANETATNDLAGGSAGHNIELTLR